MTRHQQQRGTVAKACMLIPPVLSDMSTSFSTIRSIMESLHGGASKKHAQWHAKMVLMGRDELKQADKLLDIEKSIECPERDTFDASKIVHPAGTCAIAAAY